MIAHKIKVQLEAGGRLSALPKSTKADIGDLIEWRCDEGDVTLHFKPDESPFASPVVHGKSQYMVLRSGKFPYRCTLKKKDTGEMIDWPDDGADVVISTRGT
jgi:hypothetical protein